MVILVHNFMSSIFFPVRDCTIIFTVCEYIDDLAQCKAAILSMLYIYVCVLVCYNTFDAQYASVNALTPDSACMCQWIGSAWIQVMVCAKCSIQPLAGPTMIYWPIGRWVKFDSTKYYFHSSKCIRQCRLWNGHLVLVSMCYEITVGAPPVHISLL